MASQALIGSAYTFQSLFVDAVGVPMAVGSPVITVFSYSASGVKQPLVSAQAMSAVTPAETGRYTYTYTIPTTFTDGDMLYGEMSADDLGNPGTTVRETQQVVIISSNRGTGGSSGMASRFIE